MKTLLILSCILAVCYGDGLLQYVPEHYKPLVTDCTAKSGKTYEYVEVCFDSAQMDEDSCGAIALCVFKAKGLVNDNDEYDIKEFGDFTVELLTNTGATNLPRDAIEADLQECVNEAGNLAGDEKARKMTICLLEKSIPRIG